MGGVRRVPGRQRRTGAPRLQYQQYDLVGAANAGGRIPSRSRPCSGEGGGISFV